MSINRTDTIDSIHSSAQQKRRSSPSSSPNSNNHTRTFFLIIVPLGIILRILLSYSSHLLDYHSSLSSRLELTNPIISFRHLRESILLIQDSNGSYSPSPYASLSSSRSPPLMIWLWEQVLYVPWNSFEPSTGSSAERFFQPQHLLLLAAFTLMDIFTSWFILRICAIAHEPYFSSSYLPRQLGDHLRSTVLTRIPIIAATFFLVNPFTLANCVIFNLSVIGHMIGAGALLCALKGKLFATMILLGLSAYLDMYPLLIMLPMMLIVHRCWHGASVKEYPQYDLHRYIDYTATHFLDESAVPLSSTDRVNMDYQTSLFGSERLRLLKVTYQPIPLPEDMDELERNETKELGPSTTRTLLTTLDENVRAKEKAPKWDITLFASGTLVFALTVGCLIYLSYLLSGESFDFISHSYGYSFTLPSLNPTYSIFWYFFTALFDRFQSFFLVIFHAHLLVYMLPLLIQFWEVPIFLVTIILHIVTLFKAYPTLPEYMFTGTLLVTVNAPIILPYVRRIYPILFLNFVSLLTLVLMQYLWLSTGSGNANFFFFQNLLYLFTALFTTMECIGAVRRLQAIVMEGRIREMNRQREEIIRRAEESGNEDGEQKKKQ